MPRRARRNGLLPVMSVPSSTTRPWVGSWRPVMTLNSVVLPAPFGPMSPVMKPGLDLDAGVRHRLQHAEAHDDVVGGEDHAHGPTSGVGPDRCLAGRPSVLAIGVQGADGAGLGHQRVLVELVGHVEHAVELGHLVGGERPGEAELADLVLGRCSRSRALATASAFSSRASLRHGSSAGEVAPGVEDRALGPEGHGDGGDAGADELDGAQPAGLAQQLVDRREQRRAR